MESEFCPKGEHGSAVGACSSTERAPASKGVVAMQVLCDDDMRSAFKQVQGEVPGSPIFAMKLAPPSRHLEVQLICDEYGGVASIYSRDCSVQRRHQKIVEEGPVSKVTHTGNRKNCSIPWPHLLWQNSTCPVCLEGLLGYPSHVIRRSLACPAQESIYNICACGMIYVLGLDRTDCAWLLLQAPPEVLREMERCARSLAKAVGYIGAATVEYLYTLEDGKFFFLELNPRLQVLTTPLCWLQSCTWPRPFLA